MSFCLENSSYKTEVHVAMKASFLLSLDVCLPSKWDSSMLSNWDHCSCLVKNGLQQPTVDFQVEALPLSLFKTRVQYEAKTTLSCSLDSFWTLEAHKILLPLKTFNLKLLSIGILWPKTTILLPGTEQASISARDSDQMTIVLLPGTEWAWICARVRTFTFRFRLRLMGCWTLSRSAAVAR